ncbi:hypothetical protein ACP4OV_014703 [Aristida adscensionis]
MGAAAAAAHRAPAWRSALVALCLLPVALPLLLLCLPLLCVAVAAVRFRRRRRRRMASCCGRHRRDGGGERSPPDQPAHRAALLHKYLEDQMELVGARAEAFPADAMDRRPSSRQSQEQR